MDPSAVGQHASNSDGSTSASAVPAAGAPAASEQAASPCGRGVLPPPLAPPAALQAGIISDPAAANASVASPRTVAHVSALVAALLQLRSASCPAGDSIDASQVPKPATEAPQQQQLPVAQLCVLGAQCDVSDVVCIVDTGSTSISRGDGGAGRSALSAKSAGRGQAEGLEVPCASAGAALTAAVSCGAQPAAVSGLWLPAQQRLMLAPGSSGGPNASGSKQGVRTHCGSGDGGAAGAGAGAGGGSRNSPSHGNTASAAAARPAETGARLGHLQPAAASSAPATSRTQQQLSPAAVGAATFSLGCHRSAAESTELVQGSADGVQAMNARRGLLAAHGLAAPPAAAAAAAAGGGSAGAQAAEVAAAGFQLLPQAAGLPQAPESTSAAAAASGPMACQLSGPYTVLQLSPLLLGPATAGAQQGLASPVHQQQQQKQLELELAFVMQQQDQLLLQQQQAASMQQSALHQQHLSPGKPLLPAQQQLHAAGPPPTLPQAVPHSANPSYLAGFEAGVLHGYQAVMQRQQLMQAHVLHNRGQWQQQQHLNMPGQQSGFQGPPAMELQRPSQAQFVLQQRGQHLVLQRRHSTGSPAAAAAAQVVAGDWSLGPDSLKRGYQHHQQQHQPEGSEGHASGSIANLLGASSPEQAAHKLAAMSPSQLMQFAARAVGTPPDSPLARAGTKRARSGPGGSVPAAAGAAAVAPPRGVDMMMMHSRAAAAAQQPLPPTAWQAGSSGNMAGVQALDQGLQPPLNPSLEGFFSRPMAPAEVAAAAHAAADAIAAAAAATAERVVHSRDAQGHVAGPAPGSPLSVLRALYQDDSLVAQQLTQQPQSLPLPPLKPQQQASLGTDLLPGAQHFGPQAGGQGLDATGAAGTAHTQPGSQAVAPAAAAAAAGPPGHLQSSCGDLFMHWQQEGEEPQDP